MYTLQIYGDHLHVDTIKEALLITDARVSHLEGRNSFRGLTLQEMESHIFLLKEDDSGQIKTVYCYKNHKFHKQPKHLSKPKPYNKAMPRHLQFARHRRSPSNCPLAIVSQ